MRKTFVDSLIKLAKKDKKIILLTGDLGWPYLTEFKKVLPKQFINCGVIEQTMVGIAAGLALGGKKPYVYSSTNFLVFRAYEQIRNDICYQNLDVKLIGAAGGMQYNFLGFSHNLEEEEDRKVLEHLPNLYFIAPENKEDLKQIIKITYRNDQPTYIRI
jgi:transketolase